MSTNITFERMCKLKEESGAKIEEISESTKIGKYTLKNYFTKEESIDKMNMTNFYMLAQYFHVTTEYLMGDTDVRNHIFVCPDGDKFIPSNPVYHFACQEFVKYLVENKGFKIEDVTE